MLDVLVSAPAPSVRWSPATRIAFRFCVLYFGLYVLTTQMITGMLVVPKWDFQPPEELPPMKNMVSWIAAHVFHVAHPLVITGSGSGDKTFNWVAAFFLLVVAAAGTIVWSVLDRRRLAYPALDKWFRIFMRFAVGTTMLTYAMFKVFPLQMSFPNLTRLLEPYGNFSPMGVLWASIGASPGYERFAGSMELLAAVLLFVPRLSLLGAMVAFADSVQIFALNMTYDVPVKLFSLHLILMSLFLLAPDMRHLIAALVRRVPAGRVLVAAQIVLGIYFVGMNMYSDWHDWRSSAGVATKPALYGVWNVDRMYVDGIERSPLITDWGRWRRVLVQTSTALTFQRMDDTFAGFPGKYDMAAQTIALTRPSDKTWKASFTFQRPDNDHMTLDGKMDGHQVKLQLTLVDRNKFLLVSRGFNWIQEFPFNR